MIINKTKRIIKLHTINVSAYPIIYVAIATVTSLSFWLGLFTTSSFSTTASTATGTPLSALEARIRTSPIRSSPCRPVDATGSPLRIALN